MPRKAEPTQSRLTGDRGEQIAAEYLARRGCEIVARNWRANPGEIDIVARCPTEGNSPTGEMLIFVEVRTRHGERGFAEESVSPRKASGMISAALQYLEAHGLDPDSTSWRIDVVGVAVGRDGMASVTWTQGAVGEDSLEY
jgi:putative endonuclease